jgi:hypothetical protein
MSDQDQERSMSPLLGGLPRPPPPTPTHRPLVVNLNEVSVARAASAWGQHKELQRINVEIEEMQKKIAELEAAIKDMVTVDQVGLRRNVLMFVEQAIEDGSICSYGQGMDGKDWPLPHMVMKTYDQCAALYKGYTSLADRSNEFFQKLANRCSELETAFNSELMREVLRSEFADNYRGYGSLLDEMKDTYRRVSRVKEEIRTALTSWANNDLEKILYSKIKPKVKDLMSEMYKELETCKDEIRAMKLQDERRERMYMAKYEEITNYFDTIVKITSPSSNTVSPIFTLECQCYLCLKTDDHFEWVVRKTRKGTAHVPLCAECHEKCSPPNFVAGSFRSEQFSTPPRAQKNLLEHFE